MRKIPVIDLHCDLLAYLQGEGRLATDAVLPCAIPYLRQGGVRSQVMAIYTNTEPSSVAQGLSQFEIFTSLPDLYPDIFTILSPECALPPEDSHIGIRLAIENASSICSERCLLSEGIARLDAMVASGCKPLYMSLTWNNENRFGGGAHTPVGLKEDGKRLLDWMHANAVAIDFSHTSDALAYDILDYIAQHELNSMRLLASHSNMRSVHYAVRNLPDELVQEIIRYKGVLGINFVRYFVSDESSNYFANHVSRLLHLGGEDQICLGADFFYPDDALMGPKGIDKIFFPDYQTAASYPNFLALLKKELGLNEEILNKIAYHNAEKFLCFSGKK